MLNFGKITKILFTFFLSLFIFVIAQAQVLPSVYVKNLVLESNSLPPTFSPGEKISGSFDISNDSSELLTNLYYEVKLVGNFQDGGIVEGIPLLNYDSKVYGPLNLASQETKKIIFEYELPKFIGAGDLGIEVQARLSSGQWLGWKNQKIKIVGEAKMLETSNSFIESGGAKFSMNNGPTLRLNEKATLNITLANKKNISSPIIPRVTFYKQSLDGKPISEITLPDIALPAGKSAIFSYELPHFTGDAGTYVGVLVFSDKIGNQVYPDITFRYILPGESFVFQNISVDRGAVRKGEVIKVGVTFSGQPDDIQSPSNNENQSGSMYDLSVLLISDGLEVASHSEKISGSDFQTKVFELKAIRQSSELSVIAKISDGDKILAEYKANIPKTTLGERFVATYQYFIIIILMILMIILSMRKLKKTSLLVMFIIFAHFILGANIASAASVSISRSAPDNYSAYNMSQQFNLDVAVTGTSCSNEHQHLKIFTTFVAQNASCPADASSYTEKGSSNSYEHQSGADSTISKVGNFSVSLNAPSTAGIYKLCYMAKVYEYGVGSDNGNTVDGVQNVNQSASVTDSIIVSVAPPPTNLNLVCEAGTAVATWTAPSGYNTFYFRANPGANTWPSNPAIKNDSVASTTYSFSGTTGTTYHVWIQTKAADGAWSPAVDGNVTCKLPKPTNLVLTCPSPGTTVNATWTAPAGYNQFNLRANPVADDWTWPSQVRTDNITGTSSSFMSQVDKTYHVWVETASGSLWSDPAHANITCVRPTAACSVSPTFATTGQTVTWTATSTGLTAPVTYSWQGDEFANGQTSASFSGSYSSPTPETKHATATVMSNGVSIAVPCPGTVTDGGVGPDTCNGTCGIGIGLTEPRIDGSCPAGLTFSSEPTLGQLSCVNGTKTGPVTGGENGPWGWTCVGSGPSATNDTCTATKKNLIDPNLTCTLERTLPTTTNIQVNKKNTWVVTSVNPCPTCSQAKWSVDDKEYITALTLDTHIFTTTGLKTVSVALASSTDSEVYGPACTATSVVAQEGGSTGEL